MAVIEMASMVVEMWVLLTLIVGHIIIVLILLIVAIITAVEQPHKISSSRPHFPQSPYDKRLYHMGEIVQIMILTNIPVLLVGGRGIISILK